MRGGDKSEDKIDEEVARTYEGFGDEELTREIEAAEWTPTQRGDPDTRTVLTTIRLSRGLIRQLQDIAARKGLRYQTLVKMWLTERLQEELAPESSAAARRPS